MDKQAKNRRGPLLWLADLVRHRPATAAFLAVLFSVLALISVWTTVLVARQRRLEAAREEAQEAWRQSQQPALAATPGVDSP